MSHEPSFKCEVPLNRTGRIFIVAGGIITVIALVILLSAGVGTRLGVWDFRTGFMLLKSAAIVGVLAALASCGGVFSVGKSHKKHASLAAGALLIALATVAIPLSWKMAAGKLPRIHDISTDTVNPPSFSALLPLRHGATNPPEYAGPAVAIKQHEAYPDIQPLVLNLTADKAFAKAVAVARDMRWQIVAEVPAEGRIEAIDTTFWFGFKDDIVIRITSAGNRSVVDIRSESRVGISDVGTNARRIRNFFKQMRG